MVQLQEEVERKEQELRRLSAWPVQMADDARKWIELWESDFGKVGRGIWIDC